MEEIKEENKLPKWLRQEGDKWIVTVRDKEYVFEEQAGEVVESAYNLSEITKQSTQAILIGKSLVEPKINESEITSLPGSVYLKLSRAITYVYDMEDFLE